MPASTVIRIPRHRTTALVLLCTVVGILGGFALQPLADWLASWLGNAPAILRMALELPGWVAIGLSGAAGALFGLWLVAESNNEALKIEVSTDQLVFTQGGAKTSIERADILRIFLDGKDLVSLDARGYQLQRHNAHDLPSHTIESVLTLAGYPFVSTGDLRAQDFTEWIDGYPPLSAEEHAFMRTRIEALRQDDPVAALKATELLSNRGVIVRVRKKVHQVRRARI